MQENQTQLPGWIEALGRKVLRMPHSPVFEVNGVVYLSEVRDELKPEIRQFSKTMLRDRGRGDKLSTEYVEQKVIEILWEIKKSGDASQALPLLNRLSEDLDNYDERRLVYVPLTGIKMMEGVDELRLGDVILKK